MQAQRQMKNGGGGARMVEGEERRVRQERRGAGLGLALRPGQ